MPFPTENDPLTTDSAQANGTAQLSDLSPPQTTLERDTSSQNYLALVAQATNDAVRDWDVKAGRLAWPHGLSSLFGYTTSSGNHELSFWQNNLHADDAARTASSIRDALVGDARHWHGEYRFRRA